jgi:peptidoglycan hydrolase-like protein with peptidoglycan-binding domain
MKAGLAFVLAVVLSLPAVARADLDAGVQAYQAGDYPTAFREWWAAAEGGDIRAQVRLAGLYEKGLGVERNGVEALRWYDLAVAAGDAEAKAARDALAAGMSPDQVVRARDRATAWIDKHQRANPPLAGPPSVGPPLPGRSAPTAATVAGLETAAGPDSVVVKDIQRRLSDLGYDPGPVDGVAGQRTARAIRAFQQSAGLTVDGRPSRPLLVNLESTQVPARRRPSTGTDDADQGKLVGAIIDGDVDKVRQVVAGGRVDVDEVRTVSGSKWSVLRQAVVQPKASPEMVKVLLDAGASDAPDTPCDEQALNSAILHSTVAVVRALLAGGLDPNACNTLAEALAVWESKPEMVTALTPLASLVVVTAGLQPVGVLGKDAEDADLAGEEVELLQRQADVAVVGVALDLGVELGGVEAAADQVALQLGHVDAVGGEAAHRLVQRRRHVAHPEHEAGHRRPRLGVGDDRLAGHDHEPGGVVLGVLDVGAQADQAVDLAGQFRGDHRLGRVAAGRDLGGGAGGVDANHRLDAELADQVPALVERVDMAVHVGDVVDPRAGDAKQMMVHPLIVLADDVQAGSGEEVVDIGDPAGDRVLDRDHRQCRLAILDRGEGVFERAARQRRHLRTGAAAGEVRVGSRLALEGDGSVGIGGCVG